MSTNLDPQVTSSLISTIGGALFGGGGVGAFGWWRGRRKLSGEARCERICANMVSAMETVLAVAEALGSNHPGLQPSIVRARVAIDHAREYLNDSGSIS